MSEARVHIKAGDKEIELVGTEEFVSTHLGSISELLERLQTMGRKSDGSGGSGKALGEPNRAIKFSTATIAKKLNCKSAPELAVAAAARLTFVNGKAEFSRQELLTEMKTATGYYNATMVKNLSHSLRSLVGKKLNEVATDRYALTGTASSELENALRDE